MLEMKGAQQEHDLRLSLDGLLPYLDKLIRFEWNRAHPTRRAELKRREEPRPEDSLDGYTTIPSPRESPRPTGWETIDLENRHHQH
jgi:hypothetical protein